MSKSNDEALLGENIPSNGVADFELYGFPTAAGHSRCCRLVQGLRKADKD